MKDTIGRAEEIDNESSFAYYEAFNKCDLLTPEEERELLLKRQEGDEEARERLICSNMGLVFKMAAQKYAQLCGIKSLNFTLDDLVQEGTVGLIKAVDLYDCEKYELKFSTYAWHWIREAMNKFLVTMSRTIRIPDHRVERMLFTYSASQVLEKNLGRIPTTSEICDYINHKFNEKEVEELLALMENSGTVSLDTPCNDEDPDATIGDFVPNQEEDIDVGKEQIQRAIDSELSRLSAKEQLIIKSMYGLDDGEKKTLEETSTILFKNGYKNQQGEKMSKQRVAQIKDRAMKRIKPRVLKRLYGKVAF